MPEENKKKVFNNPKLNNLSKLESISECGNCSVCKAKLYIRHNSMEQELGGSWIVLCSDDETHFFEMDRRTHKMWRIDRRGNKIE